MSKPVKRKAKRRVQTMTIEESHNAMMAKLDALYAELQRFARDMALLKQRTAPQRMVAFKVRRYGNRIFRVPEKSFRGGPWVTWSQLEDEVMP